MGISRPVSATAVFPQLPLSTGARRGLRKRVDSVGQKTVASPERPTATRNADSSAESTAPWKCTEDNSNDLLRVRSHNCELSPQSKLVSGENWGTRAVMLVVKRRRRTHGWLEFVQLFLNTRYTIFRFVCSPPHTLSRCQTPRWAGSSWNGKSSPVN